MEQLGHTSLGRGLRGWVNSGSREQHGQEYRLAKELSLFGKQCLKQNAGYIGKWKANRTRKVKRL